MKKCRPKSDRCSINPEACGPAAAIIPAAGLSLRLGGGESKLLKPLAGRPLICYTLQALAAADIFDLVVLAVRPEEQAAFAAAAQWCSLPVEFAEGGQTRQESVCSALAKLQNAWSAPAEAIVVVHDGARCFASPALFQRVVAAAQSEGAVTAALPLVDSIKRVDAGGYVLESVDREGIWAIQTPQAFLLSLLSRAHAQGIADATDDARLVEEFHLVQVVEGERLNFKVTTPEDYELAQRLMAEEVLNWENESG